MLSRIFPLFLLFLAQLAWSQVPTPIQIDRTQHAAAQDKMMACADQFAGTISFANFVGQSNDIDLDTIYFCFGDEIDIVHDGNANLTGDPNPLTLPGITYAYLNCPPTISGPDLTTILTDPCIVDNPPPSNDLWVTGGGQPNGNITFSNTGVAQNIFNGGDPLLLWFAPITYDRIANIYESLPGGDPGPCTNMNIDEAFAVVYLNQITTSNTNTNTGQSGCQGTFQVFGGLPQFDGSNYNFDITLIGNSSVKGTVISGAATHGSTVEIQVPVPGVYTVLIEDDKSCGASLLVNMSACVSVSQSIQQLSGAPGDNICLDVTNESGFNDIVAMQYGLTWDETVLQYTGVTNLTPLLPSFSVATSFNSLGDSLIFSWGNLTGIGIDLPPGTVMYQICFDLVGGNGDCSDVSFIVPENSTIEVVTEQGSQLGFNGIDGGICISNSALVVNFTQTPVSCPSGTNGSFTTTVNGGTAPYQVSWQNTAGGPIGGPGIINIDGGSFTANNLSAGTYSVTVTDNQGQPLISVESYTVNGPPSLNISFNDIEPLCNGGSSGTLTANLISGGLPVNNPLNTYSFAWSAPGAGNVTTINSLPSGNYSVTVTNNNNPQCTVTATYFLDEPDPLVANITSTDASCSGIGDGSLSVLVTGGTPDANQDYTIEWPTIGAGLTIIGTTSNVVGLASDYYQLVVTDDNGCVIDQNIFLSAIKVLSVNAVVTPINCASTCSGGIFLTAFTTGGTPSTQFNFDWFGSPVPPPPVTETSTTSTMANLCPGTLTVIIETPEGCEIDTTFILTPSSGMDLNLVSVQNESCVPGNDGVITTAPTGGTMPFTYTWTNTTATGPVATGLSAGTYSVTVEDSAGCIDSLLNINVAAPTPPNITSLLDDMVSCSNSVDGTLTVTATAGSSPIAGYLWSNGQAGATISGLSPGIYSVTVADISGCTASDTAEVLASAQIVIDSFQVSSPQCPGLGGGNIIAFVSGGTSPYFMNWSNGLAGNNIFVNSNLVAGNYSVTVSDANGCPPAIGNVTLSDPPSILATFSAIDSVSCANTGQTCDGTATAVATYSDGSSGLFNFFWISGETDNNLTSSTAVQLCAGSQRLIVSDGICNDTFFVDIPAPDPITPGQDIENVSCFGLSDGEITLQPTGGTPPYDIIWANGTQGPILTGLPAGNYTAVIMDANNCNFTHTVTIIEPSVFEVFLNQAVTADISCPGEANGVVSVVAQGGNVGTLVYLWGNGVAGTDQATATGLSSGTYSVTVVDPKGCSDTLSHSISEPPPIQFTLGDLSQIQCFGDITTITVDSVWGGNPNASYVFSSGACIQLLLGEPCPVLAGDHDIEILDVFNGCTVDTTINVAQPQEISVTLPTTIEIELGDSLTQLDPTIVSSFPIDTFIWSPAENLSCADCKNPRVLGVTPTTYMLTIIDINGCTASAQIFVDIDRNRNVYIPNVFSPNGDGINDKFQIYTGIGVSRINFVRIFDRWGELVFEELDLLPSIDGTPGWDGVFRDKDMDPAVFIYTVEVEFVDGRRLVYRGDVTLLR